MTHAELCALAVRWLKRPNSAGGHGCLLALSEGRPESTGECPDAIGFRAGYNDGSVLVEVKVGRGDFLADRAKPFRQPGAGMGTWRYYMAPAGLIRAEELPPRWGLLEVTERGTRRTIKPIAGPAVHAGSDWRRFADWLELFKHENSDIARERALLVRLLARIQDPEAVNQRLRESMGAQNRMAMTIEKQRQELQRLRSRAWAAERTNTTVLPISPIETQP